MRELMTVLVEGLGGSAASAAIMLEHDPAIGTDAEGPPVWVKGNRAGLRLALRHILENAIQFRRPAAACARGCARPEIRW